MLDRTKEPGSIGEPLFLDVVAALTEAYADGERAVMPRVIGGRYGLSSKEFTPGMVAGVFAELAREQPRRRFTVGINDDVSGTSLTYDAALDIEPPETVRAVFFGLGSDGTVGANKNTIKILGAEEGLHRAGLLRLRLEEVRLADRLAPALRPASRSARPTSCSGPASSAATSSACSSRSTCSAARRDGATLLLNCRAPAGRGLGRAAAAGAGADPGQATSTCTRSTPARIARDVGLAGRTNIVLQTCFFAISGVLPREQAIERIKAAIAKTYGRRGAEVVERNEAAVDRAARGLHQVEVPERVTRHARAAAVGAGGRPDFVRTVTAEMLAGRGDELPVSALPVDGTYPSGTTAYEKRNISELVAVWDADLCIQCGNCSFVCPHSVIRSKLLRPVTARGRAGRVRVGAAERRRPARYALHPAGLRRGLHRLRAVRRGLPGRRRRATRCARRSTSAARAAGRGRARRTSRSSRRSRRPTARGSTSARCAARSSSSRCSSSPAPARAAARRRTSSCSRSCSATG